MLYKLLELTCVADGFVGAGGGAVGTSRGKPREDDNFDLLSFSRLRRGLPPTKPPATQPIPEQIETLSNKCSLQASRPVRANTD